MEPWAAPVIVPPMSRLIPLVCLVLLLALVPASVAFAATLVGGPGPDQLTGGGGADRIVPRGERPCRVAAGPTEVERLSIACAREIARLLTTSILGVGAVDAEELVPLVEKGFRRQTGSDETVTADNTHRTYGEGGSTTSGDP